MIETPPQFARNNYDILKSGYRFPAPIEDRWRAAASGVLDDEQLHALVLLDGRLEATRLNSAVRLVMDAVPILGCRFRPSSAVWERRTDLDNLNLWMVQVETQRFTMDTRPGVYRYIASPRSPVDNPVFEARLYRSSTDMLVLKAHHAITDSIGLKTILYLIVDTYVKLNSDPAYRPPIQVSERDITPFLASLPSQTLQQVHQHAVSSHWTLPFIVPPNVTKPNISLHKIPAPVWQAVKDFIQQQRISIDELLLAAYYLALDDTLTPKLPDELPVILHRDLRGLFTNNLSEIVANMSAGFLVSIRLERTNTIADLLPRIRIALQKTKLLHESSSCIAHTGPVDFNLICQEINRQRKKELESFSAIPSLAILGDFDAHRLNFGDAKVLDAYMLSPVSFAPRFEVGLSSFEDALTISARYDEEAIDPGLVDSLLRSMASWLSVF